MFPCRVIQPHQVVCTPWQKYKERLLRLVLPERYLFLRHILVKFCNEAGTRDRSDRGRLLPWKANIPLQCLISFTPRRTCAIALSRSAWQCETQGNSQMRFFFNCSFVFRRIERVLGVVDSHRARGGALHPDIPILMVVFLLCDLKVRFVGSPYFLVFSLRSAPFLLQVFSLL